MKKILLLELSSSRMEPTCNAIVVRNGREDNPNKN